MNTTTGPVADPAALDWIARIIDRVSYVAAGGSRTTPPLGLEATEDAAWIALGALIEHELDLKCRHPQPNAGRRFGQKLELAAGDQWADHDAHPYHRDPLVRLHHAAPAPPPVPRPSR